jgi:hypothetical protein
MESLEFDNPWNRKISSEESSFLYFILINIAYLIDFIRNKPRKYNNNGEVKISQEEIDSEPPW